MTLDEAVQTLDSLHPAPPETKGTLFQKRLARLMKERSLSQVALATAIGCSRGAISYWASGKRLPAVDVAVNLAKYFGVTVDYLTGADGETDADKHLPYEDKSAFAWAVVKKELSRYTALGTVEELEQAHYNATL